MTAHDTDPAGARDPAEDIIRVAAELFMNFGYAATSIDAIAAKLGATKGLVYHHFKSKSHLYFEIQRTAMAQLFEEVEPHARAPGRAADRLRAMARVHLMMLLEEMPVQKVAVQGLERYLFEAEGFRHAKSLAEINRLRDQYEQMFAEVIDQGAREGDFLDLTPRLLTKPFFGALNWVTVWYRPRRLQSDEDVETVCETLVEFAIKGLRREKDNNGDNA
ncbi:TetR/AcrR family transcriptional regulator [Acuticoccus sp. I52.16.1]|uniref:TetR/AcrR family transcriptional regulator n=1 Tax=Acuticoccus sp. I52.16.1 TaxID=2928472 RepID=UPI001FD3BF05|nr:TetR/AcrR family transcriptional regulator [Acuticoccus sp. I52.16.1]UOM32644.1 TetR/AcrR family transcriptional regulator [Acuticoccus sp. I52.16.1]